MKKNIYHVFDETENKTVSYFEAPSFGLVVRNNWRFFQKVNPYFDEDWSVSEIGYVSETGRPVFASDAKPISWSEYLNPEIQAERLDSTQKRQLQNQPAGVTGNPPPEVK